MSCLLTIHSQIVDGNALQIRHVAKGRENYKTCQDTGEGVDDGYCQGVPVGGKKWYYLLSAQRIITAAVVR